MALTPKNCRPGFTPVNGAVFTYRKFVPAGIFGETYPKHFPKPSAPDQAEQQVYEH
jgi:hypothetical protein